MTPLLSIVIPSHRRADLLRQCLQALRRHSPARTEIIVVDDGSTAGLIRRTAMEFVGVRVVRLPTPQGFCAAANAGIQAASAPVVELLNDDAVVEAGWAEAALVHLERPEVGAVAPLVLLAGSAVIDSAGDRYYLGGIAGKRGHGQPVAPGWLRSCAVFGASASSAFYRRDALLRVGAFPPSFGAYFEDVDLAFRLRRAGYQIVCEPAARVRHHVGGSYGKPRRRLLEQQSLNEERVFWRNFSGALLWRALPHHALVLAAKGLRRWHEGGLLPFVLGRLRILTELRSLHRHRRWLATLGPPATPEAWAIERRWWGAATS